MTYNPTDDIVNTIKAMFPEMSDEEQNIEYLTQMWVAATNHMVIIYEHVDGDSTVYTFIGRNVTLAEPPPGEHICSIGFYNKVLSEILISAIDKGYVYVVDTTGAGDFGFRNAHEISMDDFFVHAMDRDKAKEFVIDLIDETDSV